MATYSDYSWMTLEGIDLGSDASFPMIAREFADYVDEHLRNEDGIDPDTTISEAQEGDAQDRVNHWLRRILRHKRAEINHWPNETLEKFCDAFETLLESSTTHAIAKS